MWTAINLLCVYYKCIAAYEDSIVVFVSGIGEKDSVSHKAVTPTGAESQNIADTTEVVLRRTQSFEADEK
jgi:hypothetical protein